MPVLAIFISLREKYLKRIKYIFNGYSIYNNIFSQIFFYLNKIKLLLCEKLRGFQMYIYLKTVFSECKNVYYYK